MIEKPDDVLTPDEISKLLQNIDKDKNGSQQVSSSKTKDIALYDFQNANKLSKDQIRTLEFIHEGFARSTGTALSASLGGGVVTLGLLNIRQTTFREYLETLADPSNLIIFGMSPLEGKGIFEMSNRLGFLLIDKMLGGKGDNIPEDREISSLEQPLLLRISRRLFRSLQDAWSSIVSCEIEGEMVETKPQFIQFIAPSDIIFLVSFMIDIDGFQDTIKICLPFSIIEPIVNKLDTSNVMSGQANRSKNLQAYRNRIEQQIESIELPVSVVLAQLRLKMSDLLTMEPNDVIALNRSIEDPVKITVGKNIKFLGTMHKKDGRYAIKIENKVQGGAD